MHNSNTAQSANFKFVMTNNLMHTEFFAQSFSGLGLSFNEIIQPYFGHDIKRPGDTISFGDISLNVLIDEDLEVLQELYDTMAAGTRIVETGEISWNNIFEGILHLSTNRNNVLKRIRFKNCWIREVGDIDYSTTEADATIITSSVTIPYDSYIIETIE